MLCKIWSNQFLYKNGSTTFLKMMIHIDLTLSQIYAILEQSKCFKIWPGQVLVSAVFFAMLTITTLMFLFFLTQIGLFHHQYFSGSLFLALPLFSLPTPASLFKLFSQPRCLPLVYLRSDPLTLLLCVRISHGSPRRREVRWNESSYFVGAAVRQLTSYGWTSLITPTRGRKSSLAQSLVRGILSARLMRSSARNWWSPSVSSDFTTATEGWACSSKLLEVPLVPLWP